MGVAAHVLKTRIGNEGDYCGHLAEIGKEGCLPRLEPARVWRGTERLSEPLLFSSHAVVRKKGSSHAKRERTRQKGKVHFLWFISSFYTFMSCTLQSTKYVKTHSPAGTKHDNGRSGTTSIKREGKERMAKHER